MLRPLVAIRNSHWTPGRIRKTDPPAGSGLHTTGVSESGSGRLKFLDPPRGLGFGD